MEYRILHKGAYPIVSCMLKRGEKMKAESDAMVAMSGNMEISGSMKGGFMGGLARKFLAGESFFFQEVAPKNGNGFVLFSHALPGEIADLELDGSHGFFVQKGGYLASETSVEVKTATQNLSKGLFSKEGFFILKLTGRGVVFLSSYGSIHPIKLEAGEEIVVDNGHLVAWPDNMYYNIEKSSNGWISSIMSGEALVCRFRGPGTVLIQTKNPRAFEAYIRGVVPPSN